MVFALHIHLYLGIATYFLYWGEQVVLSASRTCLYPSNLRIAPFLPRLINKSTPPFEVQSNANAPRLLLPGASCADCAKTHRASMKLLAPTRRVVATMYEAIGRGSSRRGDLFRPSHFS